MTSLLRRRTLPLGLAGALLLAAAAGCADKPDGDGGQAGAASSSAPASSSAAESSAPSNDELSAGLLPAEAFGPDSQAVTVDLRELSSSGAGGLPAGGTVTPPDCQQDLGPLDLTSADFGTVVAQTVTTPAAVAVEVLAEDDQISADSENGFDDLLAKCSHLQVAAPDGSTATVDFQPLQVPDVGDASDGVTFTVTAAGPDGSTTSVPCLLAVAVKDHRLVFLEQVSADGAPLDPAAFSGLVQQAYDKQKDV